MLGTVTQFGRCAALTRTLWDLNLSSAVWSFENQKTHFVQKLKRFKTYNIVTTALAMSSSFAGLRLSMSRFDPQPWASTKNFENSRVWVEIRPRGFLSAEAARRYSSRDLWCSGLRGDSRYMNSPFTLEQPIECLIMPPKYPTTPLRYPKIRAA